MSNTDTPYTSSPFGEAETIFKPKPDLPPPSTSVGPIAWMRENLFGSIWQSVLTVLGLYLVYLVVPPILNWAFFSADFVGESREDCTSGGACWAFIKVRFLQFMYGFYPIEERWRPSLVVAIGLICIAYVLTDRMPHRKWVAFFLVLPFPIIGFILLSGGMFGLSHVPTDKWSGFLLTLVVAFVGIGGSLPIGIVLALGRRSKMPVIQMLCIGFIEFIRAVPLITILFMSIVILPLFLPPGTNFDALLRSLIGVTLFSAAYMAETVRGGLQAIPKGQYEAASALGLGYWRATMLIVLPQALKIVIPAIVSLFIGLFKDTTLLLVIGLTDFLQMIQLAVTDAKWIGLSKEGYVFAAVLYFCFCFGMSRYSIYLERRLDTGYKR